LENLVATGFVVCTVCAIKLNGLSGCKNKGKQPYFRGHISDLGFNCRAGKV
jgi:hypothetical protein